MRPTIGMVTAGPLIELAGEQWRGASDGAAANDCDFVCFVGTELEHPNPHKRRANAVYDLISPHRLDALIMWTTRVGQLVGEQSMRDFATRFAPMPIISVETTLADWPTILMDNRGGMEKAVTHLIEVHGHRRIAFVRGPQTHAGAQERYQGYVDALKKHGIEVDPRLVTMPGSFSWDPSGAADAVAKLLEVVDGPPDSIAAANDDYALGVIAALDDAGLRVPEDVAVVGYDNHTNIRTHDLGYVTPPEGDGATSTVQRRVNIDAGTPSFTTVRAPFFDMGRRAADLAVALINGEKTPQVETMPTELVVRRSCGCLPSGYKRSGPAHGGLSMPKRHTADSVATNLRLALGPKSDLLPEGWAENLPRAFLVAGRTGDGSEFLHLLAECLRASARAGFEPEQWWPPLFDMHRFVSARIPDALALGDMWLRVQLMVAEAFASASTFQYLLHERRDQTVREAGQRLIASRDVAELTDALVEELPRLGIPGCHVMAYEPDAGTELARPVVSYELGKLRPDVDDELFPSVQLTPYPLERDTPYSILAAPLHGVEEQLGFVLFEVGPQIGWIYEAVQQQLSSALRGIRMIQRERQAVAEAQDARRKLELAHGELEDRVKERTRHLRAEIAERERLETQLRHAQKMEAIGRLTGGIAHDFNNILTVISGNSEALLRRTQPDDPRRPEIEDIRHAGERATNLTHQLLAFTRQQVLHPTRVDLNRTITKVRAMLSTLVGEDVELTLHLPAQVSPVWADAGQLEQILFNLAANARDAMPDGGVLRIETSNHDEKFVSLRVIDTGTGMDEAVLARVYEPYFTTKPVGKGTGLGMATVFGIVQQSDGQIDITSAVGVGTTVEIRLPRGTTSGSSSSSASRGVAAHQGSETILLVEDDDQVRTLTKRFLQRAGYLVIEARNGKAALKVASDQEIDLVVTDVVMPKMGGPELVAELRRIRPGTRVLYMSGYTTEEKLGDTAVLLTKPYTEHDLLDQVRALLDQD
ncbi:hypothetical protein Lesp02_09810 [Lentzea sp. NBRC 105346]|uniref:substrate-binding domain-containing protein n=1 Tax=Lentzea sp. NBRC 105346 TaxID=3032205 RepID=UPI0024A3B980|nr:substrate-binding domain-containing protein [Lentzea sp. NBRC 105346]GLZ28791.1 hypothetical protein Lesp02_09810 [Lentzea sp. NBRC 105346]